jgi:hypothetical protein
MDQACLDKLDGKITTEFWERKNAEWLEQEQQVQFALAGLRQANEPAQLLTASLTLELANKSVFSLPEAEPVEQAKLLVQNWCDLSEARASILYRETSAAHHRSRSRAIQDDVHDSCHDRDACGRDAGLAVGRHRLRGCVHPHSSLGVVRKRSDHEGQEQRGSGASAGVFGCNSASISGAMEAESARIFVRDAEQSAPLLQQGRAVRFVARVGRAEDSSLRASCIPAHARKFALAHGSHAESCAGTVAAR